jgi:hypothetical protein
MRPASILVLLAALTCTHGLDGVANPNLVHIVIDDLGFFDVGYKDSEIISPNLDSLRAGGVELGRFYSFKWCAPSRASMMTGRYPWKLGYYSRPSSDAVPLAVDMLPAVLRRSGYRTHAVGKWVSSNSFDFLVFLPSRPLISMLRQHLGYRLKEYTPTFRGFDSYMGFYNSMEDYWTHYGPSAESARTNTSCAGIDMSNNSGARNASGMYAAPSSLNGTYSSEIYSSRVAELLADHVAHHSSNPLYLYLPFQSVHMPNEAPVSSARTGRGVAHGPTALRESTRAPDLYND